MTKQARQFTRIPKIVHMYWDGNPMSWLQAQTVITFHNLNPEWEIRVYTPIQPPTPLRGHLVADYTGADFFHIIQSLDYVVFIKVDLEEWGVDGVYHGSLQSDIFRDFLLYKEGGLWSDFDVLWVKPIEHLMNVQAQGQVPVCDMGAFACMYKTTEGHHNVSLLMAAPNHPLFRLLTSEIKKIQKANPDHDALDLQVFGTVLWNKLFPTLGHLLRKFPDVVGFPYKTFYPYSIHSLNKLYNEVDLSLLDESVVGIHWFNGATLSKDYVNGKQKNGECTMGILTKHLKLKVAPRISVVMAYFNRKAQLYQTLLTIAKSAYSGFEIIVIDDASQESERIEGLQTQFPFLKVIRVEPSDKWYSCSCIAFNRGIAEAKGDIIIIQNPECSHIGDILTYVDKHLTEDNYLSMACFAPDYTENKGWYNHPEYRPVYYHFCSAITKSNMLKLGGFDERYAMGLGYDDNEFVERVTRLGLKKIIPTEVSVIHQPHSKDYGIPKAIYRAKFERNRAIYEILTKGETTIRKENLYAE